jgi:hypothetical protein
MRLVTVPYRKNMPASPPHVHAFPVFDDSSKFAHALISKKPQSKFA